MPHSQWCKMDQRRAAMRQRCDRSTSRSLDDVFRTECDEAGELCFQDVRTRWFPHRTLGMSSALGRERWPFSHARTVSTHVFLGLVSLILARSRQVGEETGSSAERPQKGVVDGHG